MTGTSNSGKEFKPTAADRKRVEEMAAMNHAQLDICKMVLHPDGSPITPNTLRKYFSEELERGAIMATDTVARAFFINCTDQKYRGTGPQIQGQKFWLNTKGGWATNENAKTSFNIIMDEADADA